LGGYHLFLAPKKNLSGHKFGDDGEVEIIVIMVDDTRYGLLSVENRKASPTIRYVPQFWWRLYEKIMG
jgi:hypothetical protein